MRIEVHPFRKILRSLRKDPRGWSLDLVIAVVAIFGSIIFNLVFAIKPKTAGWPPIKEVPADIMVHPDWAEANYIAQGRYLESLFGRVQILVREGQTVPGPVFFLGTNLLQTEFVPGDPPKFDPERLFVGEIPFSELLAPKSDTECVVFGAITQDKEPRRCTIRIYALGGQRTALSPSVFELVDSNGDEIVMVDRLLLEALEEVTGE